MTDVILSAVEAWTGVRPNTCPWRALMKEFVVRCMQVEQAWEDGALQWVEPNPSYKLVQGVRLFHQVSKRIEFNQLQEAEENRKRQDAAMRANGARS